MQVTSYQLATLRKLQERRLKEMREEEELKEADRKGKKDQEVLYEVMASHRCHRLSLQFS